MPLSPAVQPAHVPLLHYDWPPLTTLPRRHGKENQLHGTQAADEETEQRTRLLGNLLFSADLHQHTDHSSLQFPQPILRHWLCTGIDPRMHVSHHLRNYPVFHRSLNGPCCIRAFRTLATVGKEICQKIVTLLQALKY